MLSAVTTQLIEFALASLVIIIVPGPDLVLLLRNAATGGRRGAAATAAGIMTGNGILAAAAVAGLTALLTRSELLYSVIRIAGALYLAYLGVRSLVEFTRHRRHPAGGAGETHLAPAAPGGDGAGGLTGPRQQFRQGLLSNLLNPKVAAFYLSLFPQFVLPGLSTLSQHVVLAGLFWALALLWYLLVVAVLGRVQRLLLRRQVRRGISGVAGLVLVGLGATLALRG